MKIKLTKKLKTGLVAFALQFGIITGAHAGGAPLLQLPIEGLTAENSNECIKLFKEKLGYALPSYSLPNIRDVRVIKDGSTNLVQLQLQLRPGHEQVSLSDVEKALEGSPFTIKREQLEYVGNLRLRIGKIADHEKFVSALATLDGKKLRTRAVEDTDGSLLITLSGPTDDLEKGTSTPLITHQRLTGYLSENKVQLIAISWWRNWHLGAPFGARAVAEESNPAQFVGTNVSTNPSVRVQAHRGKPKSPYISFQVYPVMEKLFAKKQEKSAEITVSLDGNGAHLSSTLHVTRKDAVLKPLNFLFSPAKGMKGTLTIKLLDDLRATGESMDLTTLCKGKELTR